MGHPVNEFSENISQFERISQFYRMFYFFRILFEEHTLLTIQFLKLVPRGFSDLINHTHENLFWRKTIGI